MHFDIKYEQIPVPPAVFQWFPLLGDSTTLYVTSFSCFMVFPLVFNMDNRSPHLWFRVNTQSTACVNFHYNIYFITYPKWFPFSIIHISPSLVTLCSVHNINCSTQKLYSIQDYRRTAILLDTIVTDYGQWIGIWSLFPSNLPSSIQDCCKYFI